MNKPIEFNKHVQFGKYEVFVDVLEHPQNSGSKDGHIDIALSRFEDKSRFYDFDFYIRVSKGNWYGPSWRNTWIANFELSYCSTGWYTIEIAETDEKPSKQHPGIMKEYTTPDSAENLNIICTFDIKLERK